MTDSEERVHRSSLIKMLFLFAVLAAGIGVVSYSFFRMGWIELPPPFDWAAAVLFGAVFSGLVVHRQYAVVSVGEKEVYVFTPQRGEMRFDRSLCRLRCRADRVRVKGFSVWTIRVLQIEGPDGFVEIELRNFSKREFMWLMADLLRVPVGGAAVTALEDSVFLLPKADILRTYRRLSVWSLLVILLATVVACAVFWHLYPPFRSWRMVRGVFIFSGVVCVLPSLVVAVDYCRIAWWMPECIAFRGDELTVDGTAFPLSENLVIFATPPDYALADFAGTRTMKIESEWGQKGKYYMGMRPRAGNGKIIYGGYGELCQSLERAAAARGVVLLYDL